MKGVMRSMVISKIKLGVGIAAAIALAGIGIEGWASPGRTHPAQAAERTPSSTPALAAVTPKIEKPAREAEPGSERFVLENGLTVILRPIKGSGSTALVVLYAIGNDHDPIGKSGLAHLLEHVYVTAAAGFRRYPDVGRRE
jgi:hypothetical protein